MLKDPRPHTGLPIANAVEWLNAHGYINIHAETYRLGGRMTASTYMTLVDKEGQLGRLGGVVLVKHGLSLDEITRGVVSNTNMCGKAHVVVYEQADRTLHLHLIFPDERRSAAYRG